MYLYALKDFQSCFFFFLKNEEKKLKILNSRRSSENSSIKSLAEEISEAAKMLVQKNLDAGGVSTPWIIPMRLSRRKRLKVPQKNCWGICKII